MQVLSKARVDTRSPGTGVGRCDHVWVLGPEAQSSARVVHAQPLGHSSSLDFLISGPANPGWKVVVVILLLPTLHILHEDGCFLELYTIIHRVRITLFFFPPQCRVSL